MISMNLVNNYILNIKNANYCCIISETSKSEAINLMQNIDLIEKSGTLEKVITNTYEKRFLKP